MDVQSSMDYSEGVFLQLDDSENLLIKTLTFHMIVLDVIDFKQNDLFQYKICGNYVTDDLLSLIFVSLQT